MDNRYVPDRRLSPREEAVLILIVCAGAFAGLGLAELADWQWVVRWGRITLTVPALAAGASFWAWRQRKGRSERSRAGRVAGASPGSMPAPAGRAPAQSDRAFTSRVQVVAFVSGAGLILVGLAVATVTDESLWGAWCVVCGVFLAGSGAGFLPGQRHRR